MRPINVDLCAAWPAFRAVVSAWRPGQNDPRIWYADLLIPSGPEELEDKWRIRLCSYGPRRDEPPILHGETWPRVATVSTGEKVVRALRLNDGTMLLDQIFGCLDVARCELGDLFNRLDSARPEREVRA